MGQGVVLLLSAVTGANKPVFFVNIGKGRGLTPNQQKLVKPEYLVFGVSLEFSVLTYG